MGVVEGRFYDHLGVPTAALHQAQRQFDRAKQHEEQQRKLAQRFPGCNSRWSQSDGGEVWCSERSGGIQRGWVGRPRQMRNDFDNDVSCVCVRKADLGHPKLREYRGCAPDAERCKVLN